MNYSEYILKKCDEKAREECPKPDYEWMAKSNDLFNNHMDFLYEQCRDIIKESRKENGSTERK